VQTLNLSSLHYAPDLATAREIIATLQQRIFTLEKQSLTDPLTGAANRRAFDDRLGEAYSFARRTSSPLSVVVLDLDNFKRRNDEFGHAAGDRCLKLLADRLRANARACDTFARIGGEEFALILPNTTAAEARGIATRIASQLRAGCCMGGPLTFSAGVAELDDAMLHPTTIVDLADAAMYSAKTSGKDRVQLHKPTFRRSAASGR
jgi:diguanylate cyclase (GGDEF)-like protein